MGQTPRAGHDGDSRGRLERWLQQCLPSRLRSPLQGDSVARLFQRWNLFPHFLSFLSHVTYLPNRILENVTQAEACWSWPSFATDNHLDSFH